MANVGYQGLNSDDDEYHSAGSSPTVSRRQEMWTFERDIGQGGFGVVKLFTHKLTGDKLVLKECRQFNISRENFERWTQELDIVKRLDHPNIVKAQNIPEGLLYMPQGNVPCICMEFCEGGDLRQVLRDPENCCGLPEEDIRQICADVNSGIQFLHKKKVIHRDLKPENILRKMVDKNRVVYKLTDFGYAKSYDQSSVCTSLVGTMQYVAPEVLKGQRYNSSVDVWSFGVVVFECITGIRPFLHGEPSMNIFWVDCVAKKGPKAIHLYFKDDSDKPASSDELPRPHRLSRPLSQLLTTWLQTALQYNPDLRGAKRLTNEDAPCIAHMQQILTTKVINVICTSTGDVLSYDVNDYTTIGELKSRIQKDTSIKTDDQYLLRPDGTLPLNSDLGVTCVQGNNIGLLFMFLVSLMPSFKVMHDNNLAVSRLTAHGDEQISPEDRRIVFSHVFHHIRAHHTFFDRLHQGHKAVLYQIRIQCTLVRNGEQNLLRKFDVVATLISLLRDMLSTDQSNLQELPPVTTQDIAPTFDAMSTELEGYSATLTQLTNEIADMRKEAETYLRLADEMIETDAENGRQFDHYHQTYVAKARNILADIKNSKGRQLSPHGRMQDVLLQAINQAQSIIERKLNGVSFCQEYVALGHLIRSVESNKERVESLKRDVTKLIDRRTETMWRVVRDQSETASRRNTGLVMSSSFDGYPLPGGLPCQVSESSDFDQRRSVDEGVSDPDMVRRLSVSKLQRNKSLDETRELVSVNQQLLKRLASVPTASNSSPPTPSRHGKDMFKSIPPLSSDSM